MRQQHTGKQHQSSAEDFGQVQRQHVEGRGNPLQTKRFSGRNQEDQQHEPIDDLADQGRYRRVNADTRQQFGQTGTRHQTVQADLAEQLGQQGVEQFGHDEAKQYQHQCNEQVGNESGNLGPQCSHRGDQALGPGIEFHFSQPYQQKQRIGYGAKPARHAPNRCSGRSSGPAPNGRSG